MHVRWKRKLRFKISFKKETLNLVLTRINPNELNDLQLYITTPRCYLVIVYNREQHPLIGRRLENLDSCPSTLISPCFSNRQGGETEVEQRCVLSPAGTRGFLAGNGDTRDRSFLSSLPQSAFGPWSTGMGEGYRRRNDRRIGTLSMRFTREQSRGRGGWGRRSFRSSRVRSIYQTPRKLNRRVSLKTGRSKTRAIFVELSVARFLEQANSIFSRPRFNRE